jgi:propionyl-CoA synthetase
VPVVDNWWQTETGWPIVANCLGLGRLPVKPGSATRPVPGWRFAVMDDAHRPCAPGQTGSLMIELPLPPGGLTTLWQADQRLIDTYLSEVPGYYKTADAGFIDSDGYVHVMSRTDDVINVAGHRLSTGAIEEVLASHPAVAECAVIGVDDALKGQLPFGFLVLKAGVAAEPAQVAREAVALVRERIGPVACFKLAAAVERLPKTRSGKILRGTMQKIANGETYQAPPTIDDPQILAEIAQALAAAGFPRTEDADFIPVSGCN